jgi:hypothetical protein
MIKAWMMKKMSVPWNNPTMTSNVLPSPYVISASTEYGAGFEAYRAMDGDTGTYWNSNVTVAAGQWLSLYVGTYTLIINYLTIKALAGGTGFNSFKFQGCNDGATWVDIYSDSCANNNNVQPFTIPYHTPYTYFRILCVTGWNASQITCTEITMSGYYP